MRHKFSITIHGTIDDLDADGEVIENLKEELLYQLFNFGNIEVGDLDDDGFINVETFNATLENE